MLENNGYRSNRGSQPVLTTENQRILIKELAVEKY
jgi:hypothetical protein